LLYVLAPCGRSPAHDIRDRIVSRLDATIDIGELGTGLTRLRGGRDRAGQGLAAATSARLTSPLPRRHIKR